ncbi:MAG: hypothetical protein H0U85_04420 [Gemmatimonadales bacterium]|nr:hypothetical protein [Gemmatimonadales bacterium]
MREARLKPEFATFYPDIEPNVWIPASLLSARRLARIRMAGDAASLARVLDEQHFEFRGDRPRLHIGTRSRSSDTT